MLIHLHIVLMTAFMLPWQNWVIVTEAFLPRMPKIFIIWLFTENVWIFCSPLTSLTFHFLIHKMRVIMIISTSHQCWGSKCILFTNHSAGAWHTISAHECQFLMLILLLLSFPPPKALFVFQSSDHTVFRNITWLAFSHLITSSKPKVPLLF